MFVFYVIFSPLQDGVFVHMQSDLFTFLCMLRLPDFAGVSDMPEIQLNSISEFHFVFNRPIPPFRECGNH